MTNEVENKTANEPAIKPLYGQMLVFHEIMRRAGFTPDQIGNDWLHGAPVSVVLAQGRKFVARWALELTRGITRDAFERDWKATTEMWNGFSQDEGVKMFAKHCWPMATTQILLDGLRQAGFQIPYLDWDA